MSLYTALTPIFEEQVAFRQEDHTPIDGSVYIGDTEFLPVETLRADPDAHRAEFNNWLRDIWVPEQSDRLEQLLKLHGNEKRYDDLREAVQRRQAVPFIGSGMSVPSNLPTWSGFLQSIRTYTSLSAADVQQLLDNGEFEEATELLQRSMPPNLFDERVEHDLKVRNSATINGAVRLIPVIFSSLALTTNLDPILELLYDSCLIPFDHILCGQDLARYRQVVTPTQRFLLKLHGDRMQPQSRVLTPTEYDRAYGPNGLVRSELTLVYQHNHLLFLGCSLGTDRTVQVIGEVAATDPNMPRHYAFLADPLDDGNRIAREHFLVSRNIYPIWYVGDHDQSLMALLAGLDDATGVT